MATPEPEITEEQAAEGADEAGTSDAPAGDDNTSDDGEQTQTSDVPGSLSPKQLAQIHAMKAAEKDLETEEQTAARQKKEQDAIQEKLENEAARHRKRLGEILGEEVERLVQCEACPPRTPGYHYPADAFEAGDPSRTLYEFLDAGGSAFPPINPRYVRCGTCDGHTKIDTQSRDPLQRFIVCWDCGGTGYRDTQKPTGAVVALAPVTDGVAPVPVALPPEPQTDHIGRPVGHPNYGKLPIYLTPDELAIDKRDGFGFE
jgi:hypothetical protein